MLLSQFFAVLCLPASCHLFQSCQWTPRHNEQRPHHYVTGFIALATIRRYPATHATVFTELPCSMVPSRTYERARASSYTCLHFAFCLYIY
ncbi:hypothetical protein K491DRAFT_192670 [Lophiostoma macrostomum CBS 122681]|uniref:Secreted protein n=1 Tax=Lophiostoma macrostomum CBS 122681 TaxID=1314788 RepID=A0A6A6THG8_9PLEO|nr:hypothetical protein K491DRAFT_192670 [Lophiostoma macrostomum CBS 122681]